MFTHLFTFELRYWLRQPMVWIFMLVNITMFAWAAASDDLTIGGSFGNIYKNAPFVIQNQYGVWTVFALLMTTAFVQNAALRDFTYNSHQLVFSAPIRKIDYLAGRFLGSFTVALIPFLGISIGILLGTLIGQATGATDADRYGPVIWSAHLNSFLTFAVGNTFISGTFIFMLAALSRSTVVAFVGAVLLLVAQAVAGNLLQDLDNEKLVAYFDALGFGPFELVTKYWTVADKNTRSVSLADGDMGINRLIWFGVGLIWLTITYLRFSFSERSASRSVRGWFGRKKKTDSLPTDAAGVGVFGAAVPLPRIRIQTGPGAQWAQAWRIARTDFWGVLKGVAFLVILLAGLLNMGFSLRFAGRFYGLANFPVTYAVISQIEGTMGVFLFAIIIFYSGDLIWKERDADLAQMYDATPHRIWSVFVGKLLAMIGVVAVIQLICVLAGLTAQTLMGYTAYDLPQYVIELGLMNMLRLIPIIVLSMLLHTLVNNKYVAFFAVVVVLITNGYIWRPLDIQSNLVQFNASPNYTYSDMNGWGPYVAAMAWFRAYWLLVTGLLGVVAVLFWVRGKDTGWPSRWKQAKHAFASATMRQVALGTLVATLLVGGYLFYNTQVLNPYVTTKAQEKRQVAYEKTYKRFEHRPQPRITDVAYDIDLYPEERELTVRGTYRLTNRTNAPIDSLHIVLPNRMAFTISLAGAKQVLNDSLHQYQIYRLTRPMAPGDSMQLDWTLNHRAQGIENEVDYVQQINQNGSFFNNSDIAPQIGYQKEGELTGKNDRKEYNMPERERMAKLQRNCTDACMNTYIGGNSDWVNVKTTISTSLDQIAVAPGSLRREWSGQDKQGRPRRYFSYALDHPSLNFYSFISARFEVDRQTWNGIDVEVYYDPKHAYNVRNMSESIKQSLAYYTEHFGPYYHKQARIIEFPRYASFAQAFPGTMPYSESIGFISKIDPETDIDMVKYVVAHEMGHQWWAHQVIGAEMQGATLLSETMAQYSALMVMQKAYGRDRMKRFLSYEADNYLSDRGSEAEKEVPLEQVENQGYIHYRKGSLVMFNLKEFIGEPTVDRVLHDLVGAYAYRNPPYPTSYALVDRLRASTPDSLKSTITDLFEQITIYDNRTTAATSKKRPDGQYDVTINVQAAKLRADSLGRETPLPLNDLIDVGVYGKPAEGKKIGKLLAIRRTRMKAKTGTYTFTVKEQPYEAGIDPLSYLADRIPADNLKKVN